MGLVSAGGILASPAPAAPGAGAGAGLGPPFEGVLVAVALGARSEGEWNVLVFPPTGVGGTYPVTLIKYWVVSCRRALAAGVKVGWTSSPGLAERLRFPSDSIWSTEP